VRPTGRPLIYTKPNVPQHGAAVWPPADIHQNAAARNNGGRQSVSPTGTKTQAPPATVTSTHPPLRTCTKRGLWRRWRLSGRSPNVHQNATSHSHGGRLAAARPYSKTPSPASTAAVKPLGSYTSERVLAGKVRPSGRSLMYTKTNVT
jgi:hypothetical protein